MLLLHNNCSIVVVTNTDTFRYIFHHSTLGKDKEASCVVHGVVLDLCQDMVAVVTSRKKKLLRVIVSQERD